MAKFNILDALNQQSRQDEPEPKESAGKAVLIDLDRITPSPENFYNVGDIAALAASIETFGLNHDITVKQDYRNDTYTIIDGERRYRAFKLLAENGNTEFAKIPCKVKDPASQQLEQLERIMQNSTAREISDAEKVRQINETRKILQDLKQGGYKFRGRLRDIVAEMFETSPTQVARAEAIGEKLLPELQEEFRVGNIGISAAYDLAKQPEPVQAKAAQQIQAGGKADIAKPAAKAKAAEPQSTKLWPKTHCLKTWPREFEATQSGLKPWEFRVNDRNFEVGEHVMLEEWNPETEEYTGRTFAGVIKYMLSGPAFGIPDGYVIFTVWKEG
ncbi:MAG: ParB/RepB/Spo0J family partition protein [Oscillospiraceae bacterium]